MPALLPQNPSDGDGEQKNNNSGAEGIEQVMARNRPVQDELTSKLVDMVGQVKHSVTENKALLDRDRTVLDATEDAVDANAAGVSRQRQRLGAFTQRAATSWWTMIIAALVIIAVFIVLFLLVTTPV